MTQELNRHKLGRYRDGYRMIDFCQLCGKEGLELYNSECKGCALIDQLPGDKKEKFISGLSD